MFVAHFPKIGSILNGNSVGLFFFLIANSTRFFLEWEKLCNFIQEKRGDEGLFNIVMKERKKAVLHSREDHSVKTILS